MTTSNLRQKNVRNQIYFAAWCDVGQYPIRFIFNQSGSKLHLTAIDNVNE